MYRLAPAARAASTRLRDASLRMRLFSSHAPGSAILVVGGMCVARLHTTSWPATASFTAAASKTSTSDRRRPEGSQELGLFRTASHRRHVVAGCDQLAHGPLPENARGTGDEHFHENTSWKNAAPLTAASMGTVVASFCSRSATVVRASSARQASSARYMASAMAHTGE